MVQRGRGQPEQAVTLIRRALQCSPRLVDAHANLGNALCDLRRFDEAASAYTAALDLDATMVDVRTRLVNALQAASREHLRQGANATARERLQLALRLDPDRLDLIEALLPLSLDIDLLDALLLADHAWRLDGSEANWRRLWDLHNRAGEDIARCRAFLAADPACPIRLVALGNALRRAHRGQEAEANYRSAIASAPGEPFAAMRLACLLLEQGRYEVADRLLRQAEALHGERVEAMRFDRQFLAGLRERPLPRLEQAVIPAASGAPLVVFAACDGRYFERFASALLHSTCAQRRLALLLSSACRQSAGRYRLPGRGVRCAAGQPWHRAVGRASGHDGLGCRDVSHLFCLRPLPVVAARDGGIPATRSDAGHRI